MTDDECTPKLHHRYNLRPRNQQPLPSRTIRIPSLTSSSASISSPATSKPSKKPSVPSRRPPVIPFVQAEVQSPRSSNLTSPVLSAEHTTTISTPPKIDTQRTHIAPESFKISLTPSIPSRPPRNIVQPPTEAFITSPSIPISVLPPQYLPHTPNLTASFESPTPSSPHLANEFRSFDVVSYPKFDLLSAGVDQYNIYTSSNSATTSASERIPSTSSTPEGSNAQAEEQRITITEFVSAFSNAFKQSSTAISLFVIQILGYVSGFIYGCNRYFFGDAHPVFIADVIIKFFTPPPISTYGFTSLELKQVETYEYAGVIQRVTGDYTRAYSTQLLIVYIAHVCVFLNSLYESVFYCSSDQTDYTLLQTLQTYAYSLLLISYLPYVHRILCQIFTIKLIHTIYMIPSICHHYLTRLTRHIQQHTQSTILRAQSEIDNDKDKTRKHLPKVKMAPATRRTTSQPASERDDHVRATLYPTVEPISSSPMISPPSPDIQRLENEQSRQSKQIADLHGNITRMEETMQMLQTSFTTFLQTLNERTQDTEQPHSRPM